MEWYLTCLKVWAGPDDCPSSLLVERTVIYKKYQSCRSLRTEFSWSGLAFWKYSSYNSPFFSNIIFRTQYLLKAISIIFLRSPSNFVQETQLWEQFIEITWKVDMQKSSAIQQAPQMYRMSIVVWQVSKTLKNQAHMILFLGMHLDLLIYGALKLLYFSHFFYCGKIYKT